MRRSASGPQSGSSKDGRGNGAAQLRQEEREQAAQLREQERADKAQTKAAVQAFLAAGKEAQAARCQERAAAREALLPRNLFVGGRDMGIIVFLVFVGIVVGLTLLVVKVVMRLRCKPYASQKEALAAAIQELEARKAALQEEFAALQQEHAALDAATKDLQALAGQEARLAAAVDEKQAQLARIEEKIASVHDREIEADAKIQAMQSRIDLYSRLDGFVAYGMYEMPDYLYETSERFTLEIKKVRDAQRQMIREKNVIIAHDQDLVDDDSPIVRRVLGEQAKLLVRSFNIECDLLIEKVNPGNFQRTLERIDAIATDLEKGSADLQFGFNTEYVKLKYLECKLQYQFTVKKKEEQEEQRALREQMREEERARREYEKAIAEAAKEEAMYQALLDKARAALEKTGAADRQAAELRIQQLEADLAEAKDKAERAISMAQRPKKGMFM